MLDPVAPAPYVEATLARDALARGDTAPAQRHALGLPASPARDDLLGRIAHARGQPVLALEYFLAAPDVDAVDESVDARAERSPAAAYALERLLRVWLSLFGTHPDAVAGAYWHMGRFANRKHGLRCRAVRRSARGCVAACATSNRRCACRPSRSDTSSPMQIRPIFSAQRARAAQLFRDAFGVDPASADAVAGMGVVAYERGDRAEARRYLEQARALDPDALMVRALERDLR